MEKNFVENENVTAENEQSTESVQTSEQTEVENKTTDEDISALEWLRSVLGDGQASDEEVYKPLASEKEDAKKFIVSLYLRNYAIWNAAAAIKRVQGRLTYYPNFCEYQYTGVGITKSGRGTKVTIDLYSTHGIEDVTKWVEERFGPTSSKPWYNCKINSIKEAA